MAYPDGIGVEIFTLFHLKNIKMKEEKTLENICILIITTIKKNEKKKYNFKIGTIKCPKNISRPKLIFDINYYIKIIFIKKIYEYFILKNFIFLL